MSHPPGSSADTLLQHEPFVRAVVRGLLSDESRIQDVVQETWLTALRQPPRAGPSLRAWLARVAGNLARDSHRSTSRRIARERAVARPATVESVDVAYARLAAQREVVDVVLALEEPYKGVVLLRYYQDLDTAEMAQRLGRSPATVRSQLSRAHELLRSTLDSKFAGRRSAWASVLLPHAPEATLLDSLGRIWATATAKAAVAVLVIGTAAVVVVPRLFGTYEPGREPRPELGMAATPAPSAPAEPALVAASTEPGSGAREAVESAPRGAVDPVQRAGLEVRSTRELFELAVQIQRAIEGRLLTPDERIVSEHSALLSRPHTGICRILTGNGTESAFDHAITKRGGGTYFSFARQDHSYNAEPDLSFHYGKFGTGFYGIQLGLLVEVGDIALADIPERGDPAPDWLPEKQREPWKVLWSEISPEDAAHGSELRQRTEGLRRSIAPTGTASTFLIRAFSPGEHDHLVAFRPLVLDDTGCTLAWRILKTWPVPGDARGPRDRKDEHPEVPAGPSWLAETSLEELLALLGRIREQARTDLFDVPQELQGRYASVVGQSATSFAQQSGFARILHRGRWDPLVELRGGGAYFSFLTRSNSYDEQPELSLEAGRYSSGFAGRDAGWLLDLGEIPFDRLAAVVSGQAPRDASARQREAWDILWSVQATVPEVEGGGRRSLSEADATRAAELGLGEDVPAIVGHTYLLRSVLFRTHDHLVVFTVVGGDEYGHTLAWRMLRSWPVDPSPSARARSGEPGTSQH